MRKGEVVACIKRLIVASFVVDRSKRCSIRSYK
jgi:hypothetical protein